MIAPNLLEELREGIPALRETVFFNSAGIGPIPSVVADEVVRLIRYQEEHGRYRPDVQGELDELSEEARNRVARFFGVEAEEIVFTQSISEGLNIIAEGLNWEAGDEIVITDQEHTSGFMPWALQGEQHGAIIKQLPLLPDPEGIVDRLRDLLTDRTRIVALSHVTSSHGIRVPAAEVVKAAHDAGALVGFDGAQSAGQFPINLRRIGCDFYAATSYKWCHGPYGVGALYVAHSALQHFSVRRSGARAVSRVDTRSGTFDFPNTARRFEFGARNLPIRIGYGRALAYIEQIGLERIESSVQELVGEFRAMLSDIPNARIQTPADHAAGAVNVAFDGVDPVGLRKELWTRHRIVAVSPAGGLRFSLAFFTTLEEIETAVRALKDILSDST